MSSMGKNDKNPQSNNRRKNRVNRSKHSGKSLRARRKAFNRSAINQSARSIGEPSPSLKNPTSHPSPPTNPINLVINTIFRLTIVGVGIGTIFGTALANIDLTKPLFPKLDFNLSFLSALNLNSDESSSQSQTASANLTETVVASSVDSSATPSQSTLPYRYELTPLKEKFITLKQKYPQLDPGAFFVDLDTGAYVNFNGITAFPAASTIKIPILVAFFQDVDQNKVYLDEMLTMTKATKVSGSGGMQYQPTGKKYTAMATATQMIINSDNTATEMIIKRLGGKKKLNQRFREWGLESTEINNPLPDLEGTNTTSPRDLAIVLTKVNQGELISLRSRDRMLDIMQKTRTRTLLPQGLEDGAVIAHKTGDIGKTLGDAGIIDMTTGKRYIGAVLVNRPHNDHNARTLIQETSRTAYQHLKWYKPHPPLGNK